MLHNGAMLLQDAVGYAERHYPLVTSDVAPAAILVLLLVLLVLLVVFLALFLGDFPRPFRVPEDVEAVVAVACEDILLAVSVQDLDAPKVVAVLSYVTSNFNEHAVVDLDDPEAARVVGEV